MINLIAIKRGMELLAKSKRYNNNDGANFRNFIQHFPNKIALVKGTILVIDHQDKKKKEAVILGDLDSNNGWYFFPDELEYTDTQLKLF